jgi:CHAD domain-containing protein
MSESDSPFAGSRAAMISLSQELEHRLTGLTDSHGRVGDEVHQLRKAGKRLRGALVMAGEPKPCIRWIGVIGRMLGGTRDAAARLKTWQGLATGETTAGSAEAAAAALLELEAQAANRRPPQAVVDWALAALGQVRGRLDARGDEETAAAAEAGAGKLERQLRKRLKRALDRVSNDDFHDCRKAAKAWLGGLAVVAPGLAPAGAAEAEKLCGALGEENDLEVLARWLDERGFTQATCAATWKSLRKRQEKVRRRALRLIRKELLPQLGRRD